MRWGTMQLLVMCSLVAAVQGEVSMAVVSCYTAAVRDYMGASLLSDVAQALHSDLQGAGVQVSLLAPGCPQCAQPSFSTMSDADAAEAAAATTWQQADVEAAVGTFLSNAAGTAMVVTVDCPVSDTYAALHNDSTVFVQLAVGDGRMDLGWETPFVRKVKGVANALEVVVSTTSSAYVNGVIGAMASGRANLKIGVLTRPSQLGEKVRAFWQGVLDANPSVCVYREEVAVSDVMPADATTRQAEYAQVAKLAEQLLLNGTDILYTQLGYLDTATLSATQDHASANYQVSAITGVLSGNALGRLKTLGQVLLSEDVIDFYTMFANMVSTSSPFLNPAGATADALNDWFNRPGGVYNAGDYSQPMWTERFPGLVYNATNTEASSIPIAATVIKEMNETCASDASTMLQTVEEVMMMVNTSMADDTTGSFRSHLLAEGLPGTECVSTPGAVPHLQAVRDAVANCTTALQNGVALVGVGIYVINLGDVDMKAGSFYVDYNLYLHKSKTLYATAEDARKALRYAESCDDGQPCACDFGQNEWESYVTPDEVGSFNSIVNLVNIDRYRTVTPVFKNNTAGERLVDYFRVQGSHFFSPQLKQWPFDTQDLPVKVEDLSESNTDEKKLQFCNMNHYTALAPGARYFPGMELKVGNRPWSSSIATSCWPYFEYPAAYADGTCSTEENPEPTRYNPTNLPDGGASCYCLGGTKASSRYTFTLSFTRPTLQSFLKNLLPPIFIILVNQGVWFMYPNVFETRLGVCGSGLVSSVLYHVSLASNTPDTSVLTAADRFMVIVYYNNLLAFTFVFIQTVLTQASWDRLSWKSFRFTRAWGPLVCLFTLGTSGVFTSMFDTVLLAVGITAGAAFFVQFVVVQILDRLSPHYLRYWDGFNKRLDEQRLSPRKKDDTHEFPGSRNGIAELPSYEPLEQLTSPDTTPLIN